MAYNKELAERIRAALFQYVDRTVVEEKQMMGGLTFMVHSKMCVGIIKNELMCRVDPVIHDECLQQRGCHTMVFTKRPMSGYIMIDESGMNSSLELSY